MSNKNTTGNIGEQIYHVILASTLIFMVVFGSIKLIAPEVLTTYSPGKCYVNHNSNDVLVKITQIREDERDGTVILYDVNDTSVYPGINSSISRPKKEFTERYQTSYDCQIYDLKAQLTGTQNSEREVLSSVQSNRNWWRDEALNFEKRLKTCWKENANVKQTKSGK